MTLDQFRLLLVEPGKFAAAIAIGAQQLIELGVNRLSVAVLRALYQQCHEQRRNGTSAGPAEVFAVKKKP
jgi:hypothetical protein